MQTGQSLGREQQWVEKPSKEPGHGERTDPELAGEGGRARLVVLAAWVDVGQTKFPSSCVLWRGSKRRVLQSPPKPKWHTHAIGDGETIGIHSSDVVREHVWSTRHQPLPAAQHPERLM